MTTTISGDNPNGVDLTTQLNPILVTGTIAVGTSGLSAALQGESPTAWVITNQGTVSGGTIANGIGLLDGGSVTNDSLAVIGGLYAVAIQGTAGGTVDNSGTLLGTGTGGAGAGVVLTHGGSVTNEAGGQILSGGDGIDTEANAGTVGNAGTVTAGTLNVAINLLAGGSATNSGTLSGEWGISIQGASTGAVLNDGVITAGAQSGAYLTGGTVTNEATGQISGNWGVVIADAAGTIETAGTIIGASGTSVILPTGFANLLVIDPGAVFSGVAEGGNSLDSTTVSTLELAAAAAAGTLTGLGAQFVGFGDVQIDPGASWLLAGSDTAVATDLMVNEGTVTLTGTGGAAGSLDLGTAFLNAGTLIVAGGMATLTAPTIEVGSLDPSGVLAVGSAGTLAIDGAVDNSQTVSFADNTGTLIVDDPAGFTPGLIHNFVPGDRIEVITTPPLQQSFDPTTDVLTLTNGSGDVYHWQFDGTLTAEDLATGVVVPCFLAGTRIRTARGEVPVEALAVGDQVVTVPGGGLLPVVWIGHRLVACARHPEPAKVWPVRVAAGAFGPGQPGRDLWLSPDHAVFVEDVLIPVKLLANGRTIAQVPRAEASYFHVELPEHAVLLAEGLPAESFLDTDNRHNFANGGGPVALFPDFAALLWEASGCAPLVVTGPALAAARRKVDEFAKARRAA